MADGTTTGALTLEGTFECISIYANFSEDDNDNNSATFEWRPDGGSWVNGMAMTVDRRATVTSEDGSYSNDFENQFRAFVGPGLTPGAAYDVRVTFADTDGITGDNPVTESITLRDDSFALGSGSTYYVAKNGNDGDNGGEGDPWLTIQQAADSVSAGDIVYIKAGTYAETVTLSTSGADGNLVTFLHYGTDTVTIDGEDTRDNMSISADYIKIHGLRMIDSSGRGLTIQNNTTDIVLDDCYLTGPNHSAIRVGTDFEAGTGIANITIQDCEILIDDSGNGEPHIVSFENCTGGGHVLRRNTITWTAGTPSGYVDGFGGYRGALPIAAFHKNFDIYDNYLVGIPDDAIECDGGNINGRVWGNTMINCFDGVSAATCVTGPFYFFRNVYYVDESGAQTGVKLGQEGTGYTYFYHNTFHNDQATNCMKQTNGGLDNVVSRNNIYYSGRHCIEMFSGNMTGHGHDFDYDYLWTTDSGRGILYSGGNAGLEDIQGYGWETNGISTRDPGLVDPAGEDFNLTLGSVCIDAGVAIQGFNDADSPWPSVGPAPDIGAYEYEGVITIVSTGISTPVMDEDAVTGGDLNGTLVSLGGETAVDVYFEYGTTDAYGNNTTPTEMSETGAFDDGIPVDFTPGETYHYRAVADGTLDTYYGADKRFTLTMPTVSTEDATDVKNVAATNYADLNADLTNMGVASGAYVYFEWGTTNGYGTDTGSVVQNSIGTFLKEISGFDPDDTYHFRAVALVGAVKSYGGEMTFIIEGSPGGGNKVVGSSTIIIGVTGKIVIRQNIEE